MKRLLIITSFIAVAAITTIAAFAVDLPTPENPKVQFPLIKQAEELAEDMIDPVPRPYDELTIPDMRARSYPGSPIKLISTHQTRPNYISQIASYQSDNLEIFGLLTKPNTPTPTNGYPAIVFVHGYTQPDIYQTTQKYVDYVDFLARNGFVVYKIDLRGHGDSDGLPSGAYFSPDYITDTLNAYESLKTLDFVDGDNIGLWGHSMAGNITLRSMAVKPEIKAAAIWAGAVYTYTDFREYGLNDRSFVRDNTIPNRILQRSQNLFATIGDISPDNEFWQLAAPASFLDDLQGSLQLHHATDDPSVSVEYSRNLVKLLDQTEVPHELFEYNSPDHNLGSPSFTTAMNRTVDFFRTNLR